MTTIDQFDSFLADYSPNHYFKDDSYGLTCCQLALQALKNGCYGVGAVMYRDNGIILAQAANTVFQDGFNSSAHAEMNTLDRFERENPDYHDKEEGIGRGFTGLNGAAGDESLGW